MTEIQYTDLVRYTEKPQRRFIVECTQGMYHTRRCFEYKHDLKRFIEQPTITNLQIKVEDMEE